MTKYMVEIVAHGRMTLVVEADSEGDAEDRVFEHPRFPEFDKLYEANAYVVGPLGGQEI